MRLPPKNEVTPVIVTLLSVSSTSSESDEVSAVLTMGD